MSILLLLLLGIVSGATINPGSGQKSIQQAVIVSVPVVQTVTMTFDSNVHGATVYLDGKLAGSGETSSKTPLTVNTVTTGDHTATFKLAGYLDTTSSFTVVAGRPQTIYAMLQPSLNPGMVPREIATDITLQHSTLHTVIANVTRIPVSTTATGTITCPTGFMCMPELMAESNYGAGNYNRYSTTPCGWTQVTQPSQPTAEYCFAKKLTLVKQIVTGPVALQSIGVTTASAGDESPVPAVEPLRPEISAPPSRTSIVFIDKFLDDVLGGIFGHTVPKPSLNVTIVGPTLVPGPVFNSYTVAPVIDRGATIYIGEERLNVTHALNQAVGTNPAAPAPAGASDAIPTLTRIGWWLPGSDPFMTSPAKTIDLGPGGRYRSMTVSPGDFVGYTGSWYLLDASGIKPYGSYTVFSVRDPSLSLAVRDAATLMSVDGTTVTKGTLLRFSISKNIAVKNSPANLRSPLSGTRNDGFLDILVTDPTGKNLTELDVTTSADVKTTESLLRSCWDSDLSVNDCNPGYTWNTGATYSNGTVKYPAGTYTVWAISRLNNMHNNYRNAGQLYTGHTVSQRISFTLT